MHITKKFDRAFQWAGEKMGGEARTGQTDEFRTLEQEMAMRNTGMDRLHKSMASYTRWIGRRCDALEDRERGTPISYFGRTMAAHGEEFDGESELGNNFVAIGQANERIASFQEGLSEQINGTWGENLESSMAMMKEYQAARKKLESRRLAYDASAAKLNKARRDDFRIEEEVRNCKVKFEESSEDVERRMQDIKEAETENVAALNDFLDVQLEFHERCAEELRRARGNISSGSVARTYQPTTSPPRSRSIRGAITSRSRSNTARSWQDPRESAVYEEEEPLPAPPRLRTTSSSYRAAPPAPPQPPRPAISRAQTSEGRPVPRSTAPPLPLTRVRTDGTAYGGRGGEDVFGDDASTASGSGSPDYGARSLSPATSYGSLNRSTGALNKKAPPPPPPVNRARKPAPPPVPAKKNFGY